MDEMTALTSLLEKIPNLEDVEEEVNIIKNAFAGVDAENFKDKYLVLKEKYIARFRGDTPETQEKELVTEKETEPETSSMDDLVD